MLDNLTQSRPMKEQSKLQLLAQALNHKNPLEILSQGYSKLEKQGKRVESIKDIKAKRVIIGFNCGSETNLSEISIYGKTA